MILRDASSDDEEALQRLDVGGPPSPWLDEVSEIVSGLVAWRDDDQRRYLDRRVIVAVEGDEIVAVAVHERIDIAASISTSRRLVFRLRSIASRPRPMFSSDVAPYAPGDQALTVQSA